MGCLPTDPAATSRVISTRSCDGRSMEQPLRSRHVSVASGAVRLFPSTKALMTNHGLTIVPSSRRSVPRFRPGELYRNFAAIFSSTSIPRPGLSLEYM